MLCTSCSIRPPNPGRNWCQQCFQASQTPGGFGVGVGGVCTNCKIRSPNPGRSWCQQCFQASKTPGGFGVGVGGVCKNCKIRPPNPGRSWCEQCYQTITGGGNVGSSSGGGGRSSSVKPVCKICQTRPPNPGHSWCQQCFLSNGSGVGSSGSGVGSSGNNPTSGQIVLKQVDPGKFHDVKNQFDVGMSKKGVSYTIKAIYSVWDIERNRDYTNYKNSIATKNGGDANEKRWWHGSHLRCNLMNTMKLCNGSSCSICGILRKGFLLNHSGKNFGWVRFGPGLYFAPDAAKSNDYATPYTDGIKCLILCKVVVGKPKIYLDDQQHLRDVPPGYDSILGEVGLALNYPELVLYKESAVLPSYVVFYQ